MKMLKNTIAALAVASTAIAPLATSPASAHERGYWHQHGGVKKGYCHRSDRNCDGYIDRHERRGHKKPVRKGISGNDAAGIAILGIIGGAIIGNALSNQTRPAYTEPRPRYREPNPYHGNHGVFPPAPAPAQPRVVEYGGSLEPWSQGWYRYCENRYRSFNPQTGTFRGYDGKDHFCVPK